MSITITNKFYTLHNWTFANSPTESILALKLFKSVNIHCWPTA